MGCPHAMLFGKPKTGFHSMRFLGYAVGDTVGTIGLALLTAWLFNVQFWISLLVWFVGGEALHYFFGTQTAFLTTLGVTACT